MTYWHHLVPVFCCNSNSAPWWAQEFLLGRETAFPRASRILDPTAHWLLLRPSRLSCRFKMWPILNCRLFWTMRIKALSICHTKSLQIMQIQINQMSPNETKNLELLYPMQSNESLHACMLRRRTISPRSISADTFSMLEHACEFTKSLTQRVNS